ncbi:MULTISPECIES: PstS family phosphate ABC transporter substrate-binding protein [unclassified Kitasatospora]|uniref:PstS family phosphate ABC transporter substrate-binding protein n=1 Tax=unclassified Kitasatospora TaxID=2633591 RepID=UPI0035DB4C29
MRKTAAKLLTVAALATSLVTVASGSALADPTGTPAAQDIVGVGSDTTQAVLNQFSTDYNAYLGAGSTLPHLYSWDATGSSPITTKTGATSIARPNGSGAGISALKNNTSATVDFARSSRGPQSTDPNTFDFVAYATDAVAWAAPNNGDAPANLTTQNLKDIYNCNITTWDQIDPSLPSNTIKPYLPQANSGTRSFFLSVLGISTIKPCVTEGVQENEGSDTNLSDPDALVPYSVAHYIGQVYYGKGSGSDVQGPLTIRSIDNTAPVDTTNKVINGDFAATSYARTVYNVVRDADWKATDAHGTALRSIFGTTGWVCTNATAKADLKSFGFLPLNAGACGSTIHS